MKRAASIVNFARALLLPLALLYFPQGRAQNRQADSALIFINSHKQNDTAKVKALLFVSDLLQPVNLEKSLYYANLANDAAGKAGDAYYKALSLSRLGSVQTWYGKTTEALALYEKEVTLAKATGSGYLLQDAYDGIAYVYETESEWEQSLHYGLLSLGIAEKSPSAADAAFAYHQLGSVYLGMGNNTKAEQYLKKAKALFLNSGNTDRVAICDVDLAKTYMNLHFYNLSKTYLDSALQFFTSSNEPIQMAETYQQLGRLSVKQALFDNANAYYNKALEIYKAGGSADIDYAHAVLGLGEVALGRKDYKLALVILKDDYEKLKAARDEAQGLECLLYLATADSATGNFKEAYDYMQQYRVAYNAFYNEKKNKAAERMLIEFDVERQNTENRILKTRYAEQHNRLVIIISAGGVILFGALYLVILYRQKNAAFKAIEKLQEETAAKNREMLLANSVKDKLISMIAHDVRSPLASVQNTLTLTREEVITLEDFARLSQMLEMDIQHLTGMLDNTLMWAREQMLDISVIKTSFDIFSVLEEVISVYQQTTESKGVTIQNNVQPNTTVFSDKDIITTVLRNIISNAIKFTPQGKTIYIGQANIKSKVLITVKDEGVGISDDVLKKINDKQFVSTRGTDNEKGTGLGLVFSRDLLIKLGEDFQLSSVHGKGTAVTFSVAVKKS